MNSIITQLVEYLLSSLPIAISTCMVGLPHELVYCRNGQTGLIKGKWMSRDII
jgi:hypothetical protein